MEVKELITKIGFKVDDKKFRKAEKAASDLKRIFKRVSIAAGAIGTSLFALADSAANTGQQLSLASKEAGMTVEQFQILGQVAENAGISQQTFATAMQQFNTQLGQAASGSQSMLQGFRQWGVQIRNNVNGSLKSTSEVFQEVIKRMGNMRSQSRRTALAYQMFGQAGSEVAEAFQGSNAEIQEQIKQIKQLGFIYDQDAIKKSEQFKKNLSLLKFTIRGLKNELGVELMPVIQKTMVQFLKWVKANKEFIKQKLHKLVHNLAIAVKAFGNSLLTALHIVQKVVHSVGGLNNAIKIAVGLMALFVGAKVLSAIGIFTSLIWDAVKAFRGLAAAEVLADLANPFMLVGAAIAAVVAGIGLLIQDFMVYERGGKSAIGEVLKMWNKFVDGLQKDHPVLFNMFKELGHGIAAAFAPLEAAYEAAKLLYRLGSKVSNSFKGEDWVGGWVGKMVHGSSGGSSTNNSQQVTNHVNVNLAVPDGTSDQQKNFVQQVTKDSFEELSKKLWTPVINSYPRVE